jgi:hypothetical protein
LWHKADIAMNTNPAGIAINAHGQPRSLWKAPALLAAFIVLLTLMGSHFIHDWNWNPGAFFVVGSLVFAIGFAYELVTRNRHIAYRVAAGIAFAAAFVLTWSSFVQMADVTPTAAIYFGVPAVLAIGAAIARLRPNGMSRALFVTAIAQFLALAAVLILLIHRNPHVASWTWPELRGFCGNAFLVLLFAGSAFLFREAGRQEKYFNPTLQKP